MLRQRLLVGLGSSTLLFAILAIGAVLLLNRLVHEIDTIESTTNTYVESLNGLGERITAIETSLYAYQSTPVKPEFFEILADELSESAASLTAIELPWPAESHAPETQDRILDLLPVFVAQVRSLADTVEQSEARAAVLEGHVELQNKLVDLTQMARSLASEQQAAITSRFRWIVLGVAMASIIVVNVSVLMVLRTIGLVLRPMEAIVDAAKIWERERFDHRIALDQPDEFGQLAVAFNQLAQKLEVNEQRKIETLQQAARTLNHELNNALSIISLQVQLLDRSKDSSPEIKERLVHIRACLARMTGTVDALKHIRRIVLTDYVLGEKMLDLPLSIVESTDVDDEPHVPVVETNPRGSVSAQHSTGPVQG